MRASRDVHAFKTVYDTRVMNFNYGLAAVLVSPSHPKACVHCGRMRERLSVENP